MDLLKLLDYHLKFYLFLFEKINVKLTREIIDEENSKLGNLHENPRDMFNNKRKRIRNQNSF